MHLGIAGYPFGLAVVSFAVAYALRGYRKLQGAVHGLIFAGVFLGTISVTVWLDTLAAFVSSTVGTIVLLVFLIGGGIMFTFEVVLRHMHHPVRTPVISAVFGITLAIAIGDSARLIARAAKSPAKTAQAFGAAVTRIQSGKAATAVPPGHRLMILVSGLVIIAVILIGLHYAGRMRGTPKMPRSRKGGRGGTPLALPPGGQVPAGLGGGKSPGALVKR